MRGDWGVRKEIGLMLDASHVSSATRTTQEKHDIVYCAT